MCIPSPVARSLTYRRGELNGAGSNFNPAYFCSPSSRLDSLLPDVCSSYKHLQSLPLVWKVFIEKNLFKHQYAQ